MSTKLKLNKRSLTLIEIVIVIGLIAMAFGILAFPLSKALQKEKFERGVQQMMAKLSLAQELMLDFHTDVHLTFSQSEKKRICCHIDLDLKLPDHLEKSFNRYEKIDGIEAMLCDGQVMETFTLCYDKALGTTPKTTLTFIHGDLCEKIVLNGYPAQTKRGDNHKPRESHALYPEEILSII